MTNYAELIAEAEQVADEMRGDLCANSSHQSLFARLAAAVRELAPPEGWRVTEYANNKGIKVWTESDEPEDWWKILNWNDPDEERCFPTASAAMAALDGRE